jgi:PKD repeat protein
MGNAAWQNAGGIENGDLCSGNFGANLGGSSGSGAYNEAIGTGHYFTQAEWSNEDGGCAARDEADTVDFSSNAPRPPGTPVTFSSGAVDPDGSIVSTSWDFGDGAPPVTGTPASHVYANTGVYQVTLHTKDISGQWDWVTKPVVVDTPPSASFSAAPSSPVARQAMTFDASGSSDSDGSIVAYHWTFGDGTAGSGATSRHTFARSGTFGAMLTVTDNLGVSSSSTRPITVAPLPRVSTSLKARTLRIVVNEPGTITIGSKRMRVTRAGAVTFKLALNRRQRSRLNAGHKVKLTLKITFVPRVGPKLTRRVTVTIHP